MTQRLKVVFGSLSELTQQLESTAGQLQAHLDDLDEALARIAASWSGDAHDRFHQCFSEWRATSSDLHQSLARLHQLTTTAHGNYTAAESANLVMWGVK
ncbi:WXG100 family type VII secretion target [Streptacidiphilus sp. PB12-B1b]|uniref:WXG100 family type VII secretion target n=1 Tax=Streptacidiphilus sp. PB12-B1b TaxID=2705012 RepID=UPI0015FDD4DF|nr:WXG100 family type VII secretion target [Streptacidiphilus sp. PB12-B1b]QMU78403.1 WXG100 family type VII secretion target [Streptacidiphilus sp. PB12-B1b]